MIQQKFSRWAPNHPSHGRSDPHTTRQSSNRATKPQHTFTHVLSTQQQPRVLQEPDSRSPIAQPIGQFAAQSLKSKQHCINSIALSTGKQHLSTAKNAATHLYCPCSTSSMVAPGPRASSTGVWPSPSVAAYSSTLYPWLVLPLCRRACRRQPWGACTIGGCAAAHAYLQIAARAPRIQSLDCDWPTCVCKRFVNPERANNG